MISGARCRPDDLDSQEASMPAAIILFGSSYGTHECRIVISLCRVAAQL